MVPRWAMQLFLGGTCLLTIAVGVFALIYFMTRPKRKY